MYQEIISFWFDEISPKNWWQKDLQFDTALTQRFAQVHQQACAAELADWRRTALGALAEVIVLDQFSRNMYRDTPQAFAQDGMALVLAQEAIAKGQDQQLNQTQRSFLYMPFMHSESVAIHRLAVELFEDLGNEDNLNFELKHKAIIDRFGRYPHRNDILGRQSNKDELEFLQQPGSSF
ncbi:DUF924 family protein [Neptunicella marina]|uniref:DUF924 domain-containing protein n=1 Tax=Neptunicella marina TaxID=2125989 RepID=A0A8J6M288_9ALTE|nr:DUF924 family protein [Neptunicella marina]MBC3766058.1 DUF924 domain-containing protein [Neptunicella marina]